jgi:hypothetical protein
MTVFARILSGLYGLVVFLIIVAAYLKIHYAGFPDGRITDYDNMVRLPLILCNVVNAVAVI